MKPPQLYTKKILCKLINPAAKILYQLRSSALPFKSVPHSTPHVVCVVCSFNPLSWIVSCTCNIG